MERPWQICSYETDENGAKGGCSLRDHARSGCKHHRRPTLVRELDFEEDCCKKSTRSRYLSDSTMEVCWLLHVVDMTACFTIKAMRMILHMTQKDMLRWNADFKASTTAEEAIGIHLYLLLRCAAIAKHASIQAYVPNYGSFQKASTRYMNQATDGIASSATVESLSILYLSRFMATIFGVVYQPVKWFSTNHGSHNSP